MNNIDWNWFFSGFAQCAAALIGITSAFVISRLLSLSDNVDNLISKIDNLILQHVDIKKRISRLDIDWYCEYLISNSDELDDSINKGDFDKLDVNEKLKKLYKLIPNLWINKKNIVLLNSRIKKLEQKKLDLLRLEITKIKVNKRDTINKNFWDLKFEAENLISLFKLTIKEKDSIISKFDILRTTIILLLISFIFTVVYPLHFLPLPQNVEPTVVFSAKAILDTIFSTQGLFLLVLFIFIGGIFIFFLIQLMNMRINCGLAADKIKNDFIKINEYCESF